MKTVMSSEAVPKRVTNNKLYSAGWYATFGLLPFGTSLLGLLILLINGIAGVKKLIYERNKVSDYILIYRNPAIVRWANILFLILLGMAFLSGSFSSRPDLALPSALGFSFLLVFFYYGGQHMVAFHYKSFTKKFLPVYTVSSVLAALTVLARFFFLNLPRGDLFFTGCNGAGTLLVMSAGMGMGFLTWRGGIYKKMVIPYTLLMLAALLSTQSRGAWLGFFGMFSVFGLFRRKYLIFILIIMIILSAVCIISPVLKDRFISIFSLEDNYNRIIIWKTTLKIIKDYPVFGTGAAVYPHVYDQYKPDEYQKTFAHAHNVFLNTAAELGLVSAVFLMIVLGIIIYLGVLLAKSGNPLYQGMLAALIGVLIHQFVDTIIWGMGIGGGFWMLLGLITGLYHREYDSMNKA